jgi:metal-responsive CopG/Arc/MetJ family transcriptional regulator
MPRPNIGRKLIPVRIDPDLLDCLAADVRATGGEISRSELIRDILREHYILRGRTGRAA